MFCPNCGKEIQMDALFCGHCGFKVEDLKIDNNASAQNSVPVQNPVNQNTQPAYSYAQDNQFQAADDNNTLITVIKVFLIIGCIAQGWLIIPLAWCIPMTVVLFKKMNNRLPIGMGLKICTLLFVSLVSGICLLCLNDEKR